MPTRRALLLAAALAAVGSPARAAAVDRVGTPGISLAALIVMLSRRPLLAAVTPEVRANPWLRRVRPEIADLPTPFLRPAGVNAEALLAARPDLVVLWSGYAPLAATLDALRVRHIDIAYTTSSEMREAVLRLGAALGSDELSRARAYVAFYDAQLKRAADALRDLPAAARPRVYYAALTPLRSEGANSLVDTWIDAAGGVNVVACAGLTGDVTVGIEDVLAWDPEVIVTLGPAQRREILADRRWQTLGALRKGRVRCSPGGVNAWCTRAAETALQVLWAGQLFHPERFRNIDLGEETRRFYSVFYDYALSADELARVLQNDPP